MAGIRASRAVISACVCALIAASCSGSDDAAVPNTTTSEAPLVASSESAGADLASPETDQLVGEPVRHSATARSIYFVVTDRFANGDPSNDRGGIEGGPLDHGFLPTDIGYHHGGDLDGLISQLPYIAELGMDAIWITPPFTNTVVQGDGSIEGSSSSYHGYWQIDWTSVDPHLGDNADLHRLVAAAHELDIDVYLDAVVNHTGDVITYLDADSFAYRGSGASPYLTADGEAFDPSSTADFPALDADSFAYTPHVPAGAPRKSPDWLNDVTLYHNRGNSTFNGESVEWGDFFGLDDLFTEHPRVVAGMTDIYASIVREYQVDGFRLDTVKHVDAAFWRSFLPAVAEAARSDDFIVFGEIHSEDPLLASTYTRLGMPATLDFPVAGALTRYVAESGDGQFLAEVFDDDDWYLDRDGNASMQVTFLSNHDGGRFGRAVRSAGTAETEAEELARLELAYSLLFTVRGQPVVYYGDEQGFAGDGGDRLARQPMFEALADAYRDHDNIGSEATPADDNFDPTHPLFEHIKALDELRGAHPVFVTGAQIVHDAPLTGFAFSRVDRDEQVEYMVVANSSAEHAVSFAIDSMTPNAEFTPIHGEATPITSDGSGVVDVTIAPLQIVAWRADRSIGSSLEEPEIHISRPGPESVDLASHYRFEAAAGNDNYAEVTWALSINGADPVILGVDDAPPYRLYWDRSMAEPGDAIEVIATLRDLAGRTATASAGALVGESP